MILLIFVAFEFISLAIISADSPISSIFRMSTTEFDNLLPSRLIKNDNLDIVAFGIYGFWYIPAIRFCDSRDMLAHAFSRIVGAVWFLITTIAVSGTSSRYRFNSFTVIPTLLSFNFCFAFTLLSQTLVVQICYAKHFIVTKNVN